MTHRIFIGGIGTETNTFVPFPTGMNAFEGFGVHRGDTSMHPPSIFSAPMQVWRQRAEALGWSVVEGLFAFAKPSGLTVRSTYEALRDELLDDLRRALPVHAVVLSLHGAMVADGYEDCEGDLLRRIRALCGPSVVVAAEMDPHCHLTREKLEYADVLVTYKENPHTDTAERAHEVFDIVRDAVLGLVRPVMASFDCRMLGRFATPIEPVRSFIGRLKSLERRDGILSISLVHGFPLADVSQTGSYLLVVADGDQDKAGALARRIGHELYAMREATRMPRISPKELIETVIAGPSDRPMVAAETTDNPGSGFAGDATPLARTLLAAASAHRLRALIAFVWDPQAFKIVSDLPPGSHIMLRIGGKAGPLSGPPLDLHVTVQAVALDASMSFGPARSYCGNMAWLRTDEGVDFVVNTERTQITHPDAFEPLGIDCNDYHLIVVKSAQHFYAGFAPLASRVLYVSAAEPGSAGDYGSLVFHRRGNDYWPLVDDPLGLDNKPAEHMENRP